MNLHLKLKAVTKKENYSLTEVSEVVLNRTLQSLSNTLSRGTIKYSEVLSILNYIGYRIRWEKIAPTNCSELKPIEHTITLPSSRLSFLYTNSYKEGSETLFTNCSKVKLMGCLQTTAFNADMICQTNSGVEFYLEDLHIMTIETTSSGS